MTAGKQVQRRQTCDMLWHDCVPPQRASAYMDMQNVRGPLLHFGIHLTYNILNTARGVNGPQKACEISQDVWVFILCFWACYTYGMLGYEAR